MLTFYDFGAPPPPAGGLQFVGGKVGGANGGTSTAAISLTDLTGGIGSAPQEGDIVVVFYGFPSPLLSNRDVSIEGWTELADLYQSDTTTTNLGVYYKIMGSPPDTELVIGPSGNLNYARAVAIHVWRGVDQTTPMDVAIQTATAGNNGEPDPPAITPVTPGAVVIAGGGVGGILSSFTSSDLEHFITGNWNDTDDFTVGMGSIPWGGSGAINPAKFGGSTSTNVGWCAATIALRPAS